MPSTITPLSMARCWRTTAAIPPALTKPVTPRATFVATTARRAPSRASPSAMMTIMVWDCPGRKWGGSRRPEGKAEARHEEPVKPPAEDEEEEAHEDPADHQHVILPA